jgi:hypothetical protein
MTITGNPHLKGFNLFTEESLPNIANTLSNSGPVVLPMSAARRPHFIYLCTSQIIIIALPISW